MVKYRGIDVAVVSQVDIQRLPEFERPLKMGISEGNVVSRFIPIYPGSQIWFEYFIEPPHPPRSMYFFKLVINGQVITSWDCTEEHGYHGKAIYALSPSRANQTYLHSGINRKRFQFCNHDEIQCGSGFWNDCIEIRVHRVKHRKRERDFQADEIEDPYTPSDGRLRLMNGGCLELGRSHCRYKYQLLDPVDEPYATFRFFYRNYDFLTRNGIIPAHPRENSPLSSTRSTSTEAIETIDRTDKIPLAVQSRFSSSNKPAHGTSLSMSTSISFDTLFPFDETDRSPSLKTKDSIEDLPPTAPRSPQSPRSIRGPSRNDVQPQESPTRASASLRQKSKNKLTVDTNAVRREGSQSRRPLSPFTSGGMLRKIINFDPKPSAEVTAALKRSSDNERGKQMQSEGVEGAGEDHEDAVRSARMESGKKPLQSFVSRQIARYDRLK